MKKLLFEQNTKIYKNFRAIFIATIANYLYSGINQHLYNSLQKITDKYETFLSTNRHLKKEYNLLTIFRDTLSTMDYMFKMDKMFDEDCLLMLLMSIRNSINKNHSGLETNKDELKDVINLFHNTLSPKYSNIVKTLFTNIEIEEEF